MYNSQASLCFCKHRYNFGSKLPCLATVWRTYESDLSVHNHRWLNWGQISTKHQPHWLYFFPLTHKQIWAQQTPLVIQLSINCNPSGMGYPLITTTFSSLSLLHQIDVLSIVPSSIWWFFIYLICFLLTIFPIRMSVPWNSRPYLWFWVCWEISWYVIGIESCWRHE